MTIEQMLRQSLEDCVADIRRRHEQVGQKATGRTMDALEVRLRTEGERIIGEIWGRPYTGALETGSRPARRKGTPAERRQMVESLKEWCRIRGLAGGLTEKQTENLAKFLAWYIKRNGTRLYRQGGRRDIITPAVEMTKERIADELGAYYETLVSGSIENGFFKGREDWTN